MKSVQPSPHTPKFWVLVPMQLLQCNCFMFIPPALSFSPETLSMFMQASLTVIRTGIAPSLRSPQFHWCFPLSQSSTDLGTNCSHLWGSLRGNAAQPRGCSCALPVAYDTLLQMVLMAWDLKYIYLPLQIYIWFPFWGYHILVIFYEDKIWAFQKCKCLGAKVTLYLKHCGLSEVVMYLCISENATELLSVSLGP